MKIQHTQLLCLLVAACGLLATSCKVEFSPNAEWRDVPVVYSVLDPEEDTVWVRVQRCYLSADNLYQYSRVLDSNHYPEGQISVHLLAWKGNRGNNNVINRTDVIVDRWILDDTLRTGKPNGDFSDAPQPIYYCVPAGGIEKDTDCVFQLVVLKNSTGDTLAQAFTTMVGMLPKVVR